MMIILKWEEEEEFLVRCGVLSNKFSYFVEIIGKSFINFLKLEIFSTYFQNQREVLGKLDQ